MTLAKLRWMMRDFPWVHIGIGIFGNASFFAGSLLFLRKSTEPAGIWLFIIGSFGMLVGSLGEAVVRYERRKHPRLVARGAEGVVQPEE